VKLSTKNRIDATEFFNAFVHAWENGEAMCQGLTIRFRKRKNGRCIFLITRGHLVVAQFPILERILRDPNPLNRYGYLREHINHASEIQGQKALQSGLLHIKDLKVGMKGVNLRGRVIKISTPKLVLTRLNKYALLATATLSDKNGTIKVPLWNQRIHSISVNDQVHIDNAKVTIFRGERQLRIGRNGKLKVVESNSSHAAADTIECIAS